MQSSAVLDGRNADAGGHFLHQVPLWKDAMRCGLCRLVVAQFPVDGVDGGGFTAYMSGGVLLGDSMDPAFTPPVCRTPYAPNAGTPGSKRGWRQVYGDAARQAVPTPAQVRALADGMRDGSRLDDGRHRPQVVARMRTWGWLSSQYRVTPSGAAALQRAPRLAAPATPATR